MSRSYAIRQAEVGRTGLGPLPPDQSVVSQLRKVATEIERIGRGNCERDDCGMCMYAGTTMLNHGIVSYRAECTKEECPSSEVVDVSARLAGDVLDSLLEE